MVLSRPDEREILSIPLQFESLHDGQERLVWSDCLLDVGTDFPVGNNGLCMRYEAKLKKKKKSKPLYSPPGLLPQNYQNVTSP